MCFRIFNPGCIQRENRWTIRKWIFVIFLLVLFAFLILCFVHQSFHYCSGPFGDSSHLNLAWHDNYDKFMKGKCSRSNSRQENENIDKLSFIARLIYNDEASRKAICAGTLIFNDIVLTAAHCLTDINLANLEVHVGTSSNTEKFANFTKNDIKINENYDDQKYTNDIALIRLNRKPSSTSTTSALCIPFDEKEIRKNLTMGEWNIDKINIDDPKIIETTVNGIDNVKCGRELHNLVEIVNQNTQSDDFTNENKPKNSKNQKEIRFEQFCAESKTVERGNSGMPVYGNDLNTGAPTIYGLVSFGAKTDYGSGTPTVLTKIYDYRHWILCNAY